MNEFLVDPQFLVLLFKDGAPAATFGIHYCNLDELKDAILFRATELMRCSMVHPSLSRCTARLVTEVGEAWFHYDDEKYRYEVTKENVNHKPKAE